MTDGLSPRVRGNDWSVLDPPEIGNWSPTRSVSVVLPAFKAQHTLPYALSALAAQTYPSGLLEVIVVDDGNDPPVALPEQRPENTRVVRVASSWGRANACRVGADASDGDVIHWLDSDMIPCRDEVEAQMRWHHIIDHAVVLGHKIFLDADDLPPVDAVRAATEEDSLDALFAGRWTDEHTWVEKIWRRSAELTTSGFRAFHVHVGATASVGRGLYDDAGGMDASLKLGEDIELGYRLAMKGGVFVAERHARNWHLGRSTLMRNEKQVQRYNAPYIAERVPDFRKFRQTRGRSYRVPMIEVVVEATGHSYEQVKYTVDGVLQAAPNDLRCLLVGPWSQLDDERRRPLDDALLDARLVHEEYAGDGRVSFLEKVPTSAFPALFRLRLPTGWRPGETTMDDVTQNMQAGAHGLRFVLLPDGAVARFERTAAFERALRLKTPTEDIDDIVDKVSSTWWSEGVEEGFLHPEHAPEPTGQQPKPAPAPAANGARQPRLSRRRRVRSAIRRAGGRRPFRGTGA